jgi:group I intron endonuclease
LVTGKSYVGSAISLTSRLSTYYSFNYINKKSKGSSIIYRAIKKYEYSKFSLDILEYCTPDIIIIREQYYIDLLKPEYNICKIAGSRLRYKHLEATKIKMSINQSGDKHPFFGKRHSL